MARINKKKKETPGISTASLPDIIFILLFFFMVVTVMRETDPKLKIKIPQATELSKLQYKEAVSHIFIGFPLPQYQGLYGTAPRIQLNDAIRSVDDVQPFIKRSYAEVPEALKGLFTVALKVDEGVTMGIVTDVKQELRKADALRILYTSSPKKVEK
jgi:biopolymer transport protein ExbD